jgi:uncharacterized protein
MTGGRELRVLYAADMHGSERVWRKFVNAAGFYKADILILGGDLTGKVMVPVVEEKPGRFCANVYGNVERVKAKELEELEKKLRFTGFYPYRCSLEECDRLERDVPYRLATLERLMVETIARWVEIADGKLSGTKVRIYGIAGNDDALAVDGVLQGTQVTFVDDRVVEVDGYQLLSSSWGNRTPWETPREMDEEPLFDKLQALAAGLLPGRPTIFNLHMPPYDSGLDTGPAVASVEDGIVTVRRSGGQLLQAPVGSTAVRRLIEAVQPVVSFHSHIHESRNVVEIGRTLCINPGSNYQDGQLDSALVELDGDRVVSYQLVSG